MCRNDFYSDLWLEYGQLPVVCPKGQEKAFDILQFSRPFIWKQIKEAVNEKAAHIGKQNFVLVSIFIEANGSASLAKAEDAADEVAHCEKIVVSGNCACGYDSTLKLEHSNISVTCHK